MSLLGPQLNAFLAIIKHKTVHQAAKEINLTQTAVTQRIRTLEGQLKTTLFIRTKRGMQPTHEGQALLRYCQAAKELEGEALANIQGAGKDTEIQIAITAPSSLMNTRIIPSCLPIMSAFPNLLVHFHVDDIEKRLSTLRSGNADLAIIQKEQLTKELQYKNLKPEKYLLVGSYQWRGRKLQNIINNERIIDFDPSDQITFNYLKSHNLLDGIKKSRHFVNRTDNIALLVENGLGYTTLTKEFAAPYIANKQLSVLNKGKSYHSYPVLAWYDRPEAPKYFSALVEAIN